MKIKPIIGSQEINTDKMNDVESEVFEKQHELCLLCAKYDIPFFAIMFGTNPLFSQHFILPNKTSSEEVRIRLVKFMEILNSHIIRLTDGQFSISSTNNKESGIEDDYNEGEDRESWKNE